MYRPPNSRTARFIPCTAKDGQAASQTVASGELDPVFSTSNGTVTFPNGDVLYVGVDGEVHTVAITALTPYARYERVTRLGDDCYVESVGEGLNVFDKNGKYLRTVSAGSLFDIPADAAQADQAVWAVGTRVFMQYAYAVPDDSRDYDFYDAEQSTAWKRHGTTLRPIPKAPPIWRMS